MYKPRNRTERMHKIRANLFLIDDVFYTQNLIEIKVVYTHI